MEEEMIGVTTEDLIDLTIGETTEEMTADLLTMIIIDLLTTDIHKEKDHLMTANHPIHHLPMQLMLLLMYLNKLDLLLKLNIPHLIRLTRGLHMRDHPVIDLNTLDLHHNMKECLMVIGHLLIDHLPIDLHTLDLHHNTKECHTGIGHLSISLHTLDRHNMKEYLMLIGHLSIDSPNDLHMTDSPMKGHLMIDLHMKEGTTEEMIERDHTERKKDARDQDLQRKESTESNPCCRYIGL